MESMLKQQEMALMDKWRAKLHAEKLIPKESDFNADGIVNYEQWDSLQRRSLPKLLFVLKETDEHSGPLIEPLADHGGNGKTWAGVAKWADALLFGKYGHANKPYRKNIISYIAAINVKKVAGGTSSDWEDIQSSYIVDDSYTPSDAGASQYPGDNWRFPTPEELKYNIFLRFDRRVRFPDNYEDRIKVLYDPKYWMVDVNANHELFLEIYYPEQSAKYKREQEAKRKAEQEYRRRVDEEYDMYRDEDF